MSKSKAIEAPEVMSGVLTDVGPEFGQVNAGIQKILVDSITKKLEEAVAQEVKLVPCYDYAEAIQWYVDGHEVYIVDIGTSEVKKIASATVDRTTMVDGENSLFLAKIRQGAADE